MSKIDKNKAIELFLESIQADLNLYNHLNPDFPLTMEDVFDHLSSKTKKEYEPKCKDCGDKYWLYDDQGQITGGCPCHY